MLNYIKSECYRILHRPGLYVITLLLCAAALAWNLFLAFFDWDAYGTDNSFTGISYAAFLSVAQFFPIMAAIIPGVLYTSAHKYGDLKNTIAFGLNRVQIFCGKCCATILFATLSLAVLLAVWIGSAELLLTATPFPSIRDVLVSIPALYLIACASAITIVLFLELFDRELFAALAWGLIWCILPTVLNTLGLRFDILADIAGWMPYHFLSTTTLETTTLASGEFAGGIWSVNLPSFDEQSIVFLWNTAEGLKKCLVSGFSGVVIFSLAGWLSLRKRDL